MTTHAPEPPVGNTDQEMTSRIRVPLVLSDRCDGPGCNAQAFVRVYLSSGELLFCGHHYSGYELIFVSSGYAVDDQRDQINHKPNQSKGEV
jgi:hypothetical protein